MASSYLDYATYHKEDVRLVKELGRRSVLQVIEPGVQSSGRLGEKSSSPDFDMRKLCTKILRRDIVNYEFNVKVMESNEFQARLLDIFGKRTSQILKDIELVNDVRTKYNQYSDCDELSECSERIANVSSLLEQLVALRETRKALVLQRSALSTEYAQFARSVGVNVGCDSTPFKKPAAFKQNALMPPLPASPFYPDPGLYMRAGILPPRSPSPRAAPVQPTAMQPRALLTKRPAAVVDKENVPEVKSRLRLIRLLADDDFESIPKYMKGRLTLSQVNAIIEKFNAALEEKYKLLESYEQKGRSMRSFSKAERDKIVNFNEQETKETVGAFFIEEDFKARLNAKDNASIKQIIPILRHCSRLKEVRGGKYLRFMVMT